MNKRGDFYTIYETGLTIVRIFVLIIFALGMNALIGSVASLEVTSHDLEADEFFNNIVACSTIEHKLDETKINNLENCLKTKEYGAEISFKDEKIIVNKDRFGVLFGLCNTKSIYCRENNYFDGVDYLKTNILVMKDE